MKKNPIKVLLFMIACMLLIFSKKDVNAAAVNANHILGTWEGSYTGYQDGSAVQRKIVLNVQEYNKKGEFSGILTIDDNKNGNYYFTGNITDMSDYIVVRFSGDKWRYNPNNFSTSFFDGKFSKDMKTISGEVDYSSSRTFTIKHTSTTVVSSAVPASKVAEYWTGEYDGYSSGKTVRRNLKMHKLSITGNKVEGVMRVLPSSKADSKYGATGRYYFSGTYDEKLAIFHLQGYKWIEFPTDDPTGSSWSFVELDGYIDPVTMTIIGYTDNGIWSMRVSNATEFETTPNYREDGVFEDKTGSYYTYSIGTASFKAPKSYDMTVTIPDTIEMYYQKYDVVSISKKAFANNTSVRKVDGGKNLTSIEDKAFYKAKYLNTVDFSSSQIKKIGKKAFSGCGSLKTIKVNGNTLSKLSSQSFKGVKGSKVYIYAKNKKTYNKVVKAFKKSGIKKAKYKFVKR